MTPQERQAKLDEIKPFALIIGFLGNGKFDACVCLSVEDFKREVKKFERWKIHYFIQEKTIPTPKVS